MYIVLACVNWAKCIYIKVLYLFSARNSFPLLLILLGHYSLDYHMRGVRPRRLKMLK